VINPAVGCHYFPPGLQLSRQPLRGLLPILLLGEQRHNGCEQFAWDCYPTASRLRFEPGPSAPESNTLTTRLPSHPGFIIQNANRKSYLTAQTQLSACCSGGRKLPEITLVMLEAIEVSTIKTHSINRKNIQCNIFVITMTVANL